MFALDISSFTAVALRIFSLTHVAELSWSDVERETEVLTVRPPYLNS